MTLKFTPPKSSGRYALFVDYGNERGLFKTFNELSSAKLSWYHNGSRSDAKILELVDGEWFTLFDIPKDTPYRQVPWKKEVSKYSWYSRSEETSVKAKPMTRDEYADWRLKVEREKVAEKNVESFRQLVPFNKEPLTTVNNSLSE